MKLPVFGIKLRGFTLIEVTISVAILGTMMLVYMSTVQRSTDSRDQVRAHHSLRSRAMDALLEMSEELNRSGHVTLLGSDYPLFWYRWLRHPLYILGHVVRACLERLGWPTPGELAEGRAPK